MKDCYIGWYVIEIKQMNKNTFQKHPLLYEFMQTYSEYMEFRKGFKLVKWNKPTNTGTKGKFEPLKNTNEVDIIGEQLKERLESINKRMIKL